MVDLYGNATRYERARLLIDSWNAPQENREAVRRYLDRAIEHLSPGRRYADLCLLKRLIAGVGSGRTRRLPLIDRPISTLTQANLDALRTRLRSEATNKGTFTKLAMHARNLIEQELEHSPTLEHRRLLSRILATGKKAFFQWPKNAAVNVSLKPANFYTYEELTELLRVARRPQQRALLALAWETTARPNEYLALTCGDVEPLPQGFTLKAHISKRRGETETRNLYVITFRAEFNDHWSRHPNRDDPSAPLFYRENNQRDFGKPLGAAGANKMLKNLDRRSGINKNGTLYFLRHGGYTWKIKQGMNEALAGRDMGWAPGSSQARRYSHLVDNDVLQERLRLADERFEQEILPSIKVRACPYCGAENSPTQERCTRCGRTLSIDQAIETSTAEMKEQVGALKAELQKFRDAAFSMLFDSGKADKVDEAMRAERNSAAPNPPASNRQAVQQLGPTTTPSRHRTIPRH